MFRNRLKYYHGTSENVWETIKESGCLKPNDSKSVGSYWITKGAYFVCENPLIALWYAHTISIKDGSAPVVLCYEYEANGSDSGEIVNLLSVDGHRLLAYAHAKLKEKIGLKCDDCHFNYDSTALQLLLEKATNMKGVIAAFQEGDSFQNIIHNREYRNKYTQSQKGICPGDHVEICFYPNLSVEGLNITVLKKHEVLAGEDAICNIWEHVSYSLTAPIKEGDFKDRLLVALKN